MMDRDQKLAKLNKQSEDRDQARQDQLKEVADSLENAVADLKKTFGLGVDINGLANLIEEIGQLKGFKESVDELKEAIGALPETVKVEDIDGIVDAIREIELKSPDVILPKTKEVDIITLTAQIIGAINSLGIKIEANKPAPQGQKPLDYVPYRRVIKVGNAFQFDDTETPVAQGGGGGGGTPTVDGYVPVVNPDGSLIGATSPTDGYGYCAKSTTATYKYFFFENKDGDWYILRKTLATEVVDYAVGTGGFGTVFDTSTTDPTGSPTFGSFAVIFN